MYTVLAMKRECTCVCTPSVAGECACMSTSTGCNGANIMVNCRFLQVSLEADLPQIAFRKMRQQWIDMGYGVAPKKVASTEGSLKL